MNGENTQSDVTQNAAQQAPASTDSSNEQTKELEVVDSGAPVPVPLSDEQEETDGEQGTDSADQANKEKSEQTDDTKTDNQPQKAKNSSENRIQQLANENRELKQTVESLVSQSIEDFDVQKAIDEGADPSDARLDAIEHRQSVDQYKAQLTELNTTLNQESVDVSRDFPYMDSDDESRTPEDIEKANQITDLWFQAADVKTAKGKDGKPIITQARLPLYSFVKTIDGLIQSGIKSGEVNGQRNSDKQLAAVEIPTGRAPAAKTTDDKKLNAQEYAAKHKLEFV